MDYTRQKVRKTSVMEHIITFLPGQLPGEEVFGIEMTGNYLSDSHYHIVRGKFPHLLPGICYGRNGSGADRRGDFTIPKRR